MSILGTVQDRVQDRAPGRIFIPGRRPLLLPGSAKRVLGQPDARNLGGPYQSGMPLSHDEIDYDDLDIVRSWRTYEADKPNQVRYFCYELAARDVGELITERYFKVVRFIRLTRVPRYLRQQPAYESMRDVLSALREKDVLFVNMIAKSPRLPLVFAYGVQGSGDTLAQACDQADEGYAALAFCLDGTYQQLEYEPLSLEQGEILSRYQAEWAQIAMARGRPMPQGTPVGNIALLDGSRTDVQGTNDALDSFIRGMGDRSFMLSLVTYPLPVAEISSAWRNIAVKLSAVRSDQQGSRGVSAGVALPLGMGASIADGHGTTHGLTGTTGMGSSDGLSQSLAASQSYTHTDGTNAAQSLTHTDGTNASLGHSDSTSTALGHSVAAGQSVTSADSTSVGHATSLSQNTALGQSHADTTGVGQSDSLTQGQSLSQGVSAATSDAASVSHGTTAGASTSVGQSASLAHGASATAAHGTSTGASLANGSNTTANFSNSLNQSLTAGQTLANNWSQSMANQLSQTWGLSGSATDGAGASSVHGQSTGIGGGFPGLSSTMGESLQQGLNNSLGNTHGQSVSQTGGGASTTGSGSSLSQQLSQALGITETTGGALGHSLTAMNSVGASDTTTAGQSLTSTLGQSVTQGASTGVSNASGLSHSQSLGTNSTAGQSVSGTAGVSASQSASDALSASQGVGATASGNVGQGASLSQGQSLTQGASLSQGVANATTATTGTSASNASSASAGVSATDANGVSSTATSGASTAQSQQQATADAWNVAMSSQSSQVASLGIIPSIGANISRMTFDEAKRSLGDILEAQMNRYHEGVEGGAFLYQMFLVTPDRHTLVGASALLRQAFWGPGKDTARLPQPFHTAIIDDPGEASRLLVHAATFTQYRRREPNVELIEPHLYSSYLTAGEGAAMSHPPTLEALGLLAQHDSMPVLSMPADRGNRDIYLGHIINGERGRVDEARFGIDLSELTHILIQGVTGLGKTTTMMRLLEQAVGLSTTIVSQPTIANPVVTTRTAQAGVLCFDWMQNMRDLANVVEPERFRLWSVSNPALGQFRWNPLEVPHVSMDPSQWLGAQADNLAASFGLGEYGRSLISEHLDALYSANRLVPQVLLPERLAPDGSGAVVRPAYVLPAIPVDQIPATAIRIDGTGNQYANVYTYPELSRLVSLVHLAVRVCAQIEELATPEGARLMGVDMRNRVQSLWRRVQYYAPGGPGEAMVASDPDLLTRQCLGVTSLIDPDQGLVSIVETDGLDLENRRVILGSVMLAVYRYGLHVGKGCFDHGGRGPGTFLVLEESHELFGAAGEGEDRSSASMRATLYESMFRRARATGLRLVAMTQNCGSIPSAVTSQTTTVLIHRTYEDEDRKRVFSLLNWSNMIGQQMREWRYLGEMPRGYCIVRLDARNSYLESAPTQILIDPPELSPVSDVQLAALAASRR